jgi:pimeloyl-ACP methyl ester carboxylesterase
MSKPPLRQGRVSANGVEFAYLEAGSVGAPLALCLHGFPDTAHTWRHLLPVLASVGYHAVAPFLRGYAPTSIPADGRYQSAVLAHDAIALIEALGAKRAAVIGHDWGAIAAHGAAILAPERVRKLVTLSVPHRTVGLALATSYDQQRRSWYIWFFQTPFADAAVPSNDFAFLDRIWQDWSPTWKDDDRAADDLAALKRCFREPGVVGAALGYYRALLDPARQDPALAADQAKIAAAEIPVETLYLHGVDDGCMGVDIAEKAAAFLPVEGSRSELVAGTGHFLHLEAPEAVNRMILDFLAG